MRPHSRYKVDSNNPRAKAVCDFCGQLWQHSDLVWQFEWAGPRLQNQRQLVCNPCNDKPQQQLRTIVLPPDPVPIQNPRPENYVLDDSPLSAIGVSANFALPQYGSRIGNLTGGGGINAAFDGNALKPAHLSACNRGVSNSSYNNYVGINWQGNVSQLSMPSSLLPPVIYHSLTSVSVYAARDNSFATDFLVQASPVDTAAFAAWTTLSSGSIGGPGTTTTVTNFAPNPLSQFHRVAYLGDGSHFVSVAQVKFSVAETGGDGEH